MKISIELDKVICAGEVAIAAIVKTSVHCSGRFHVLSILGSKRPVALLVRRHDVTTAFEIDGRRIDLDAFETRYPGQREKFERLATKCRGSA